MNYYSYTSMKSILIMKFCTDHYNMNHVNAIFCWKTLGPDIHVSTALPVELRTPTLQTSSFRLVGPNEWGSGGLYNTNINVSRKEFFFSQFHHFFLQPQSFFLLERVEMIK